MTVTAMSTDYTGREDVATVIGSAGKNHRTTLLDGAA
jgi:hypothetical protein